MFLSDEIFSNRVKSHDIVHGYFGKRGGVSRGIYSSLNCGLGTGDDMGAIRENRQRVANALGVVSDALLTLRQVHSNKCLTVTESWGFDERPEADAMVTEVPGLALGVMTADCMPIIFYGKKESGRPVIGVAHVGWRGAHDDIIGRTVDNFGRHGVGAKSLFVSIGPCIGFESYEVKEDLRETFIKQDPANQKLFKATGRRSAAGQGALRFNLAGYAVHSLKKAGVRKVSDRAIDTYFNEEDFFSYRRSQHRQEADYGRQISAICIKR